MGRDGDGFAPWLASTDLRPLNFSTRLPQPVHGTVGGAVTAGVGATGPICTCDPADDRADGTIDPTDDPIELVAGKMGPPPGIPLISLISLCCPAFGSLFNSKPSI